MKRHFIVSAALALASAYYRIPTSMHVLDNVFDAFKTSGLYVVGATISLALYFYYKNKR